MKNFCADKIGCGLSEPRSFGSYIFRLGFLFLMVASISMARAQTAPHLVSVTPADGATSVPTTSSLVFVFDQDMDTTVPFFQSVPPFLVGNFDIESPGFSQQLSGSWGADQRTLTAKPQTQFSSGTFTWTLNPDGGIDELRIKSEAGIELPTVTGSFTTGDSVPTCDPNGLPSTWGTYGISKSSNFEQTSAADPVPQNDDTAFIFSAFVSSPQSGGTVTAGSVTLPNGSQTNLTFFGGSGQFFETPATEADLNSAFPAGNYVLRFTQTGQAERVINMAMPASAPPVPKIANFAETQAVNAGADFILRWNAFTGAGSDDQLSIFISDDHGTILFQAPDLCVPRVLPVTATSVVIPANTLQSNQTFSAYLTFGHLFYNSTNTVPQMSGFGSIARETHFSIKTGSGGSGSAIPATLSSYVLLPTGNPQFHLTGTIGHSYAIQRTGNIGTPNWLQVGSVTMDTLGTAVFEDTQVGKAFPLFYRAVAN